VAEETPVVDLWMRSRRASRSQGRQAERRAASKRLSEAWRSKNTEVLTGHGLGRYCPTPRLSLKASCRSCPGGHAFLHADADHFRRSILSPSGSSRASGGSLPPLCGCGRSVRVDRSAPTDAGKPDILKADRSGASDTVGFEGAKNLDSGASGWVSAWSFHIGSDARQANHVSNFTATSRRPQRQLGLTRGSGGR
jgi:hypothetical protein